MNQSALRQRIDLGQLCSKSLRLLFRSAAVPARSTSRLHMSCSMMSRRRQSNGSPRAAAPCERSRCRPPGIDRSQNFQDGCGGIALAGWISLNRRARTFRHDAVRCLPATAMGYDEPRLRTNPIVWLARTFQDLQRVCAMCESHRRCARDLARDSAIPAWKDYCPNAATLAR